MKEIKLQNKIYLFVEIPDNPHSFREKLIMDGAGLYVSFEPRLEPYLALQSIKVSKNNKESYQVIFTTKDITEEQAESIIGKKHFIYSFSDKICVQWLPIKKVDGYYPTAKESLQSLIQANELDVNKNYLILLKK